MNKKTRTSVGLGVILILALAYACSQSSSSSKSGSTTTAAPASQPAVSTTARPTSTTVQSLPAQDIDASTVKTWCADLQTNLGLGRCDAHRFENVPEGPLNVAHMTTGLPVRITMPQGYCAQVWDGVTTTEISTVNGALYFDAEEMSVRKLPTAAFCK